VKSEIEVVGRGGVGGSLVEVLGVG